MQPFIVLGRPHMLKYLKEIGFKTFDWLIDETYDSIEDNELRMEMVKNEILKLEDYFLEYFIRLLKRLKDINFEDIQKQKNLIL